MYSLFIYLFLSFFLSSFLFYFSFTKLSKLSLTYYQYVPPILPPFYFNKVQWFSSWQHPNLFYGFLYNRNPALNVRNCAVVPPDLPTYVSILAPVQTPNGSFILLRNWPSIHNCCSTSDVPFSLIQVLWSGTWRFHFLATYRTISVCKKFLRSLLFLPSFTDVRQFSIQDIYFLPTPFQTASPIR